MKIIDIIIWILFIISIIVSLWYIFGHSPTFEQALLILIITFLFTINTRLIKLESRFLSLENSFSHLANDFKKHIK